MITVGTSEAEAGFATLLDRVAEGEEIVITKHGKPIARLVSAVEADRSRANEAFTKLKALREGTILGLPWKMLRDEGRK